MFGFAEAVFLLKIVLECKYRQYRSIHSVQQDVNSMLNVLNCHFYNCIFLSEYDLCFLIICTSCSFLLNHEDMLYMMFLSINRFSAIIFLWSG